MLATALATMTALEVVLFGENNVALFAVVKVPRFQIAPHVANLPRMKPMPVFKTERVTWSAAEAAGVELWVRRLDAVDSPAPGNKAWKLMYHVERALLQPQPALLTFGGAWSNHLHATAALGAARGLRTIGVVRASEAELAHPTPTLQDCMDFGMELFPVSRAEYKEKDAPFFKAWLRDRFGNPWIVPEGGSGALGVMGCKHLIEPTDLEQPWDAVVVAAGTGATAAGLLLGLKGTAKLYVANVLKGFDMGSAIEHQLTLALNDSTWSHELGAQCTVWNDAHLGGFGQIHESLQRFIGGWEAETRIPLDGVYTGKALLRLEEAWREDPDWSGRRVLFIHTGGLQGNRSWR
jgi:1-aminocyclopropane-1-carboxylate deaminase/D-cysteine desulfhydrase-like pyridoxal-dependent ACC family enzyme